MKCPILLLVLPLALTACGGTKSSSAGGTDNYSTSVEAGVTALSGIADDESGGSFDPSACTRAAAETCSAGVKSVTYNGCAIPATSHSLTGSVTLTYSDAACSMASTGNSVTRTFDVTMNGLFSGTLTNTSDTHADYRGNNFGGGGRLTKTVAGWDVEVLGKHKTYDRGGRTWYDFQVRSTSPTHITGGLARAARVADGGAFEVVHNLAEFTATYQPSALHWDASCCHPVSGSLAVTFTGNLTGSGTVTFTGCGTATLVKDGVDHPVTLNYCE